MMEGSDIVQAAIDLVRRELRRAPSGLTNAEVAERTGISLQISKHNGYLTWTILQHLVENGEALKSDRLYRLVR